MRRFGLLLSEMIALKRAEQGSSLVSMFGPSPCPGNYSRRWATMASADFCLITVLIADNGAAATCCRVLSWFVFIAPEMPSRPGRWSPDSANTGFTTRLPLHVKQISPDKTANFRSTTASFTVSIGSRVSLSCANSPTDSAFYDVSVRQLAALLRASFRQNLAVLPLPFANRFPIIN